MTTQLLTNMLKAACSVTGCSTKQALGRCRKRNLVNARLVFFLLATDHGCRSIKATWFLQRERTMAYYFNKQANNLMSYDLRFQTLYHKAKIKYNEINNLNNAEK